MNVKKLAALLALLLLVFLTGAAQAADYGYEIDVPAMKALEEASAFPMRVTEKKVVVEQFDTDNWNDPTDALMITVANDTNATVTEVRLCYVAYDADNCTCDIEGTSISIPSFDAAPKISSVTKSGISLAPGEKTVFTTKVSFDRFTGLRAIVSQYTDDTGNTVANPDFARWQDMAFGVSGGSVTELD